VKYKPNWDAAKERLTALWAGRYLDRPCIAVTAPAPPPDDSTPEWLRNGFLPIAPPKDAEEQWLGIDYLLRAIPRRLATTYWGGEAIPSYLLMSGWLFCQGCTPSFYENTIWLEPVAIDWDHPPTFSLDWQDPWIQRVMALYQAVLQLAGWDDFLVGVPAILPGNDILAAVLGGDEFLINLLDRPEWMRQSIIQVAENQIAAIKHCQALASTHAFPYGNAGWMTFWAPEPYMATQSDVSCMLSAEMFDEFILPELDLLGREFGGMWYHLDGSKALQHLPRLLSLPYLRVIQYVPEPFVPWNGPEWIDLYRTIQQAGKIVHVTVEAKDVEPLVRALDPGLLCLDTWCDSAREAEELLGRCDAVG